MIHAVADQEPILRNREEVMERPILVALVGLAIGFALPTFAQAAQSGFPMRASDSSVGGAAGQFHTTRRAAVMISAHQANQSASLGLCDVPVVAEGGLRP